jgi:hypothetical protein
MTPLEKLKLITAWDKAPVLSEDELDAVLAQSAVVDTAGLAPIDALWTPTYDMNAAAAAAWLIKAARASVLVEVDPPGSGIVTAKVFDNCRAMARIYRSRMSRTIKC